VTSLLCDEFTVSMATFVTSRDVNIEFFPNPDIECDNPVKIRISYFIRAA